MKNVTSLIVSHAIGLVEFMRQFDSGYGDYTKERHAWLDNLTIEDICSEIEEKQA
jgi:hypothetical protein